MLNNDWYKNKIKSSLAEGACRSHFEALGWNVEAFGIEHIAPAWCKLMPIKDDSKSPYISALQSSIQKMPDFFISRIKPESSRYSGQREILFVEAKFRREEPINNDDEIRKFVLPYQKLIDSKLPILFYLITPNPSLHVMYVDKGSYENASSKHNWYLGMTFGWQRVDKSSEKMFNGTVLDQYRSSIDSEQNFYSIYSAVIETALKEIFKNEQSN